MPKRAPSSGSGEHIFPASQLTPLAVQWKELTASGRHKEAMLVLEEIVRGSTAMFERLAQYEDFHYTVDLPVLVSAAQEKVIKWLLRWQPKKGRLFSWFSSSFAADTHVVLADGSAERIDRIVDGKEKRTVLSWNRSTGRFEPKPIINWIKTPVEDRNLWRRLSYRTGSAAETLTLTREHEVYTDRGIVRVDDLKATDRLYVAQPSITPDGMSALIGLYLGRGTVTPDARHFVVEHSIGYDRFIHHVAAQFGVRSLRDGPEACVELRRLWPNCPLPHKKAVSEWLLDNINPVALAYLYMDSGTLDPALPASREQSACPSFGSEHLTFDDCTRIGERLLFEWNVHTRVQTVRETQGQTYGRICICAKSSEHFFSLIAPHVHPCFNAKLPPAFRKIPRKDIECVRYEATPCTDFEVRRVRKLTPELAYRYDITVADHHNVVILSHGAKNHEALSGLCACQCAKNAFRSELAKVNQYRRRFHVTSENLERFYGAEDHEVDKHDAAADVRHQLAELVCSWGDPQEIGALRYLVECIIDDEHDKHAAIRGAAYAYGIGFDLSRFFYGWAVAALRSAMYERVYVPFTEQDLLRAAESYSYLPLIVDEIGYEKTKRLIVVMQGLRVKFPTPAQIAKHRQNYDLHRDLERSALDPDSVAEIAKKHKRSARSAQEIFEQMSEMLDPKRYGEHPLYDTDSSANA